MDAETAAQAGSDGAVGPPANPLPREFPIPAISPDDPAAVAIQITIASVYRRLALHEEGAREGDVEGVHRLRTSTRRLRSTLRAFKKLLEPEWTQALEDELKWLGDNLGAVRDLDILQERLAKGSTDPAPLEPLFASLRDRHDRAQAELRQALESERYGRLLARLAEAAERPAFQQDAWEPCRTALPPLVEKDWNRLKRSARLLSDDSPDAEFHEVRKRAKRARYSAEAVAPALGHDVGKEALRFAHRATEVQDVLGEHQDAVIACDEIRRALGEHPDDGPFNFAAGRLFQAQTDSALESRAEFFGVWAKLDRKRYVRWLKA